MEQRGSCKQCGKTIRVNNQQATHLWNTPDDRGVWVCGQRCLDKFNEGEDLTEEEIKQEQAARAAGAEWATSVQRTLLGLEPKVVPPADTLREPQGKKPRKKSQCMSCGNVGHNIRTCPTL